MKNQSTKAAALVGLFILIGCGSVKKASSDDTNHKSVTQAECQAAGKVWEDNSCQDHKEDTNSRKEDCQRAGKVWKDGACKPAISSPSPIKNKDECAKDGKILSEDGTQCVYPKPIPTPTTNPPNCTDPAAPGCQPRKELNYVSCSEQSILRNIDAQGNAVCDIVGGNTPWRVFASAENLPPLAGFSATLAEEVVDCGLWPRIGTFCLNSQFDAFNYRAFVGNGQHYIFYAMLRVFAQECY